MTMRLVYTIRKKWMDEIRWMDEGGIYPLTLLCLPFKGTTAQRAGVNGPVCFAFWHSLSLPGFGFWTGGVIQRGISAAGCFCCCTLTYRSDPVRRVLVVVVFVPRLLGLHGLWKLASALEFQGRGGAATEFRPCVGTYTHRHTDTTTIQHTYRQLR